MSTYVVDKLEINNKEYLVEDTVSGYTTVNGTLTDVQVNNVSVVTDGVANVYASQIIDMLYPVGAYYETSDENFTPASAGWPGTWVLETFGQVHVSAGNGYTIGSTGGVSVNNYTPAGTVAGFALNDVAYWPSHTHGENTVAPQFYIRRWGSSSTSLYQMVGNGGNVTITQQTGSTSTRPRVTGAPTTTNGWWRQQIPEAHTHASFGASSPSAHTHTATGTTTTIRTIQPFITVNRWHRTA